MFNNIDSPKLTSKEIMDEVSNRIRNNPIISDEKKEKVKKIFEYLSCTEIKEDERGYDLNFYKPDEFTSFNYNQYIKDHIKIKDFWEIINNYGSSSLSNIKENIVCPVCGFTIKEDNKDDKENKEKSIEHILPKSLYNSYILYPNNLVMLCKKCNGHKGDKDIPISEMYHPYFSNWDVTIEDLIIRVRTRRERFTYFYKLNKCNAINKNFEEVYGLNQTYTEYIEIYLNEFLSSLERFESELTKARILENFKKEKEKFNSKYQTSSEMKNEIYLIALSLENFILEFDNFIKLKEGFKSLNYLN